MCKVQMSENILVWSNVYFSINSETQNQNSWDHMYACMCTYVFMYVCEQGEMYESYHTELLRLVTHYKRE